MTEESMTQGRGTILVVDDNPTNISVLYDFLTQHHYEVLVAQDGESAVKRALLGKPDLILMDVMMPGMDGIETCRLIQEHPFLSQISIIFMTALCDVEDKVRAFGVGAVDYITKPFQQEEVLARIETHLIIRKLRLQLQEKNKELREEVEDRKRREAFMRVQQDLSPDGILFIDQRGESASHNRRWLDLWQLSAEELKSVQPSQRADVYRGKVVAEDWEKFLTVYLQNDRRGSQSVDFRLRNGRIFDLYSTPMVGAEGFYYGRSLFVRDITERKGVEASLRELNASKDRFFSIIAHDLNNPFQGIIGFSELLSGMVDTMTKEEIIDYVHKLNQSAQTIHVLLQQLLTWSRLQIGHMDYRPSSQELREMVEFNVNLTRPNAEQKEIVVFNEVVEGSYFFGDPNMVNTILRNLLNNAVKFTPRYGTIRVQAVRKEDWWRVTVEDTGVGLLPSVIERILQVGSVGTSIGTAQEKGSGLGLMLVKEMVARHGGKLSVESEVGKGSKFSFMLPMPLPGEILAMPEVFP